MDVVVIDDRQPTRKVFVLLVSSAATAAALLAPAIEAVFEPRRREVPRPRLAVRSWYTTRETRWISRRSWLLGPDVRYRNPWWYAQAGGRPGARRGLFPIAFPLPVEIPALRSIAASPTPVLRIAREPRRGRSRGSWRRRPRR